MKRVILSFIKGVLLQENSEVNSKEYIESVLKNSDNKWYSFPTKYPLVKTKRGTIQNIFLNWDGRIIAGYIESPEPDEINDEIIDQVAHLMALIEISKEFD